MNNVYPLVSIIVPIYNVEQYISRCVDSILSQTYNNIEVILINDGSTDGSRDVIEKYSRDSRCLIIDKPNGGASSSRNMGINVAKGEYIYFIDSDDYITNTAVELLVNRMVETGADFCCYRIAFFSDSKTYISGQNFDYNIIEDKAAIVEDAFLSRNIKISPWAKIFSASFLRNHTLKFKEGIINEDALFTMLCAVSANKVAFMNTVLYYAYQRPGSVSRNLREESITSYFVVYSEMYSTLQRLNLLNQYSKYLYASITKQILYTLVQCGYRCVSYDSFCSLYNLLKGSLYMDRAKGKNIVLAGWIYRAVYELSFFPRCFYLFAKTIKKMGYNIP